MKDMSQIKRFTAKRDGTLDCGHPVKPGAQFAVTSFYACEADAQRALAILRACFPAKSQEKR
jgi:hypothetical protein